jgi:hypothetical protein
MRAVYRPYLDSQAVPSISTSRETVPTPTSLLVRAIVRAAVLYRAKLCHLAATRRVVVARKNPRNTAVFRGFLR